ncbi:MAG: hypothetical protein WBN13_03695, partial [Robiginitalea sp.]
MERIVFFTLSMISLCFFSGCTGDEKTNPKPVIPEDPGPAPVASIKLELERKGYETFDYIDEKTGD